MAKPLYSWAGHELNFEPRIWELLGVLADKIYDGNRSKAANSIILFSAIHFFNEQAKGNTPTHWLTAGAMKHPEELESLLRMMKRVKETGQPEELGTWWRHELERMQSEQSE